MASALMTVPPKRRAKASASADLPLAVGPAITTRVAPVPNAVLPVAPMSYIVILVANRQAGPLTEAEVHRAKEFCAGQHVSWLSPGHAAEFIVKNIPDIPQVKMVLVHKATDVL